MKQSLEFVTAMQSSSSPAVKGLDPEKIGIEVNLVSKEAEIFVEQHPKSTQNCLGEIFLFMIEYL